MRKVMQGSARYWLIKMVDKMVLIPLYLKLFMIQEKRKRMVLKFLNEFKTE